MINVDDRLLSMPGMNDSKLWFLMHLMKYANRDMKSWPSNKKLHKDMGWSLRKMQSVKAELIKDKLLIKTERFNMDRQTSNEYEITNDLIGVFVAGKVVVDESETRGAKNAPITNKPCTHVGAEKVPLSINQDEVLTNELNNADPSGSAMKGKLFTDAIEAYDDFCKVRFHVGAKIDGAQGNAMKKILVYLRANSHDKSDEGILNAWKYILQNWEKLDDWLKGQVKLTQINSNMLNIINQLKYGHNSRSIGTTAATIDALEALARKLETGG